MIDASDIKGGISSMEVIIVYRQLVGILHWMLADSCPVDNKASVKPLGSTTYMSSKREVSQVTSEG
jgi:hypothetical protein